MATAIILSAGLSRRFGSPKALAVVNHEVIIKRLQKALLESNVERLIIVLGCSRGLIEPHVLGHKKIAVVYNENYERGQTSSFQAGVRAATKETRGYLLLPVDYPFIRKETINLLLERFYQETSSIIVPAYLGCKGHPPIFPSLLKDEILAMPSQTGLNVLAQRHKKELVIVPVDDKGVLQTFNTPEELKGLVVNKRTT